MLDVAIVGATVLDGTGSPRRRADVGVRDGRIIAVGDLDDPATETVDGTDLMLLPGFVDPHTHYDAQLFWDPAATPSSLNGVTTVISGNCGFTLAPVGDDGIDYLSRMMARVEGMSLAALEQGVPWNWGSFGEYLDRLDGRLAVNAGFLVGHSAVRKHVMGESAGDESDEPTLASLVQEVVTAVDAGALGFSTSLAFTHSDGDGRPVPSRSSSTSEVLRLCRALRPTDATALEAIVDGCLVGFTDDEVELLADMSVAADLALNWNVLSLDSRDPDGLDGQLRPSRAARAKGGRVAALTMPVLVPMNMSFLTHCALHMLPRWSEIFGLPVDARMQELRKPEVRAWMQHEAASPDVGSLGRHTNWATYVIGDTISPENAGLAGRVVGDIAAERGTTPFDALVDIVLADDLRTVLWPTPPDDDAASWALRARAWADEDVILGGSDAGAHLDRMCGASYPIALLEDSLRGRRLLPVERAVHLMTDVPAQLFGLAGRGSVQVGNAADLVLVDPERVGAGTARLVDDMPGGAARLVSEPEGVEAVFVNGRRIVDHGQVTGEHPGTLLRSGRDTRRT